MAIHAGDADFDYPGSPYAISEGSPSGGYGGGGGFIPPPPGPPDPRAFLRGPTLTPTLGPGAGFASAYQRNRLRPFGMMPPQQGTGQFMGGMGAPTMTIPGPGQGGGIPPALLAALASLSGGGGMGGMGAGMGTSPRGLMMPFSGSPIGGGGGGVGTPIGGGGGGGGYTPPGAAPPPPSGGPVGGRIGQNIWFPPPGTGGGIGNPIVPPGPGRSPVLPGGGAAPPPGAGGPQYSWDFINEILQKAWHDGLLDPNNTQRFQNLRSQAISDAGANARASQLALAGRSDVDPSQFGFQNMYSQLKGGSDVSRSLAAAKTQMDSEAIQRLYNLLGGYFQGQMGRIAAQEQGGGGYGWGDLARDVGGLISPIKIPGLG